jgi:hypothetical protein
VSSENGVEREQEDPLEASEAQASLAERHLLAARREQCGDEPLTPRDVARDDALEKAFEIFEEAGLTLLDAYERATVRSMDVGDPLLPAGAGNGLRDLVRHIHHRQRRQRRRDRVRDLDAGHALATSLGRRK